MSGLAAEANEDRVMAGIVLMLGAYLLFAFIDTTAKWLALPCILLLEPRGFQLIGGDHVE